MLALLIVSVILGGIAAGLAGNEYVFLVVTVFVFICGLPAALITGFIHGEVKYAQDRADYREEIRKIEEEEREFLRQMQEEDRYERYYEKYIEQNKDA